MNTRRNDFDSLVAQYSTTTDLLFPRNADEEGPAYHGLCCCCCCCCCSWVRRAVLISKMWHKLQYSTVHWACRMNQFGEHKLTDDARIKMSIVFLQDCLDWTGLLVHRPGNQLFCLHRLVSQEHWEQKSDNRRKKTSNYWVRMIDGDGGDQCRISNLSKEKVQVSSAVKSLCTVAVRCPELNFEFG